MPLFSNGSAPTVIYLGAEQVVQVYLGEDLIYDGTTPAVVFAPVMTAAAVGRAPGVQAGTTVAVPRMQASVDAIPPTVISAARVIAPPMQSTAAMSGPVVSVPATVEVPAMTSDAAIPTPEAGTLAPGNVLAPPINATAAMPVPGVSVPATVAAPPMTASVDAILGALHAGANIAAPVPTATGAAAVPAVSAGAVLLPPRAQATAAGIVPAVTVVGAVTAPPMTATATLRVPVTSTGVSYTDDFNRANGVLGGNWVYGNSNVSPRVSSNQAAFTDGTDAFRMARYASAVNSDNQRVQVTMGANLGSQPDTLFLRCNSGFTSWVGLIVSTGGISIYTGTDASGNGTDRSSVAGNPSISSGATLTFEAIGNVYTFYVGGVSKASWTDSGNVATVGASNRYGGIAMSRGSFTNAAPLDNFLFRDI